MNNPISNTAPQKVPLVAFEHYMLADDRATHPMTCHIRFWFRGRFDKNIFFEAIKNTLPRHPTFQMTIGGSPKSKTSNIYWKHLPSLKLPFISWGQTGSPIDEPPDGFAQNIYKEIGLRMWIRDSDEDSPTQTMLLIQFHHAVCDGIGLFQFLEDLLIVYANLAGIPAPPLRDLDSNAFAKRGEFSLSPEEWVKRRHLDINRTKTFFQSIAQPIRSPKVSSQELTASADLYASIRTVLPSSVLEHMRQQGRKLNSSVNDLLIKDLFVVLSDWNAEHGADRLWTRIAIPTSLRGNMEEKLSASNVVSMVFLSRRRHQIQNSNLLKSISSEMKEIKDNRLGIALPRVIRRLGKYNGAVYRFLHLPICSSTAVLTNLGRPFADSRLADRDGKVRIGDITLESLETMPPVRPKTSVSISVNYYGGALSVTLRYDSTTLTKNAAQEILARYCEQIKKESM